MDTLNSVQSKVVVSHDPAFCGLVFTQSLAEADIDSAKNGR